MAAPVRALDVAAGHALLRLTGRELHHLSTPDQPAISYRHDPRLHGVVGGDPAAIKSLTPWRWESYFGPKETTPLTRPSHSLKASGPALTRAQGCLLGQLTGEATSPSGSLTADSELTIQLARRILSDPKFRASDLTLVDAQWEASGCDSEPLSPLFRCLPLGLAFSPEKLDQLNLNSNKDLEDEMVRAMTRTISLAMDGAKPQEALSSLSDTASVSMQNLLDGSEPQECLERRTFQKAFAHLRRGTSLEEAIENSRQEQTGPSVVGALLGAFQGYESVPRRWRMAVLTCRPRSRPVVYWPVDALRLAEHLLCIRKKC